MFVSRSFHKLILWLFVIMLGLLWFSPTARAEEKKKAEHPLLLVINYPYQIWAQGTSKIHLCLFKPDFKPAQGAEVNVNGIVVGKADSNGVCIFDFKPGNHSSHTLKATLEEREEIYTVSKTFSCNSRTGSFRSDQVYIYTDRGVYNPGQDILIRCIAWELKGEYTPLAKGKIEITLQDSAGKIYTGGWMETNEYGIASTKIPLSENMPEGSYELVALYQKVREVASLRIQRFVPPILKIDHNLKRYLTDTQESLSVDVNLSYFSGGKIKSSSLAVKVLDQNQKTIFESQPKEKTPGVYSFLLSKEELDGIRQKLSLERPFQIELRAKDSYGRSDAVTRDVIYTARPFHAVLELDKDDYPAGETVKLLVKVIDLDGKPASQIPLSLEVSPFGVKLETKTDLQGVALFSFKMGNTNGMAVVKSPVMKYPLGQRNILFNNPKPMTSKVEDPTQEMGGESLIEVKFGANFVPIEKVIHVDLTDVSGSLVASMTIPVSKEGDQYFSKGKITAPTWGTMLVNLYCCAVEKANEKKTLDIHIVGFITEGQKITLYPRQTLKIELENFQALAKPGQSMDMNVKVHSPSNQETCLGIAVVDGAVISLLDPMEKTPRDRFYNPQLKVIASQGAGVLTWPVVDRNWGSPWRDIAYSNWGWKGPGAMVGEGRSETLGAAKVMKSPSKNGALGYGSKPPAKANGKKKDALSFGDGAEGGKSPSPSPTVQPKSPDQPGQPLAEMKKLSDTSKAHGRPRERPSSSPKIITIRTSFLETAFWEPLLITEKGQKKISFKLPDSITIQKITVVASDKQGGIALLRQDIQVRQDLFVRSGLPATMTLGDEIEVSAYVKNTTDKKVSCEVAFQSDLIQLLSEKKVKMEVESGELGIASWKIKAHQCGNASFTVQVDSAGIQDSETRTLFVQPAGQPQISLNKGVVEKGKNWTGEISLSAQNVYTTAFVNVSFPNIVPALQGLEYMAQYPHGCVEQISSRALTNIAVLEYGLKSGMSPEKIEGLRNSLKYAASRLAVMQGSDGGWGWFYLHSSSKASVYLTAYALRTLCEIREMDVFVSPQTIDKGVQYLIGQRNSDGMWDGKSAFFWEKTNTATDLALSAEIFSILVQSAKSLGSKNYDSQLAELQKKMVEYLEQKPQEPLGVANAVSGLVLWAQWKKDSATEKLLSESVDHLISLKRHAYWEPHWYHSYGGMVEVNARILELLAKRDPQKYEAYLREGMNWLLSTREAFGAWHNTMGTAVAVRALLKMGKGETEIPSSVSVRVNGKEVASVKIDPSDPFLSAASLRYLEITRYLQAGAKNQVEVIYDGNLKAPVILEVKEWKKESVPSREVSLKLSRLSPKEASLGEPVPVTLELSTEKALPFLMIEDKIPANATVEIKSLEELKEKGLVADYRVDGSLYLYLKKVEGKISLSYRITTIRTGKANHGGVTASAMYSQFQVSGEGESLTVNP